MRVILFAHPRTGTTAFRKILNSTRNVYFFGEVLYPDMFSWGFYAYLKWRGVDVSLPNCLSKHLVPFLDSITGMMEDAGKKIIGFDIKIPQINHIMNGHDFIRPDLFSIIHLKRRNVLDAIISYEIMKKRLREGVSPHNDYTPDATKVVLDPKTLIQRINKFNVDDGAIEEKYFASNRYHALELFYEDLFLGDSNSWASVQEFLGIPPLGCNSGSLVRQNPQPTREKIENIAEVESVLSKTNYINFLNFA